MKPQALTPPAGRPVPLRQRAGPRIPGRLLVRPDAELASPCGSLAQAVAVLWSQQSRSGPPVPPTRFGGPLPLIQGLPPQAASNRRWRELPRLRVVGDGGELALIAQWVAESHAAAVLALAKTSRWSVPVKRLTARRFDPLQSPSVNERGKSRRRRAPMMMFVFAVQIVGAVIGIFWATVAVTARQSPPEHGDGGNWAGIRLADHARSPPNVVIAVTCHEVAAGDLRELPLHHPGSATSW